MPLGQTIGRLVDSVGALFRRSPSLGESQAAPANPLAEQDNPEAPADVRLGHRVAAALEDVEDPGTGLAVLSMGLIPRLEADHQGAVRLTFRPSSSVCPLAFELGARILQAVQAVDGVASVRVDVENYARADELEAVLNGE